MSWVIVAVLVGTYGLERLVGEPPTAWHPVAWFGRAVAAVDRPWRRPRLVGALAALVLPAAAAGAVLALVWFATAVDGWLGAVLAASWLFLVTSHVRLVGTAREVCDLAGRRPEEARVRVVALVGRDPASLTVEGLRSAALESAAENLADGLVAPMLGFTLLASVSVPLGVAAAAWVKAVNTMDSMLGYPGTPVGTASARLDDLVMVLPARLAALGLAVVAARPGALAAASSQARRPASPNAGWPMATLGAILGVRLEKPNVYVLFPDADAPDRATTERGLAVVDRAAHLVYAVPILLALTSSIT